jgi:hypothetical protein
MKQTSIKTIYLTPHAHTDIGYSHDPVVTLELHDRFLDRTIDLCERTRDYPDGARFRWTVEVFSSLLHWWKHRGPEHHQRLRRCMERGEIEVGARYLNGTELNSPEDVAWEAREFERLVKLLGIRPSTALQNDVNGFPMSFARALAELGGESIMMGLNTTMGHSPVPRCSAFRWDLGTGKKLLVWNGWIYNRIKTYCHLDQLGEKFHDRVGDFLTGLPKNYPYDFAVTSATMGDNIGPFVNLPEQVRLFNERSTGVKLKIATFKEVADRLAVADVAIPTYSGHWPDFWTFGAGSMPQMVGMVRRAQRRLRLVEQFRAKGWANESGGGLTLDRARQAVAFACEHTYDSHSSSGETCGTSDSLRQKAQVQIDAATAESVSMALLRDHLSAMAAGKPKTPVSVLVANPHDHGLTLDYLTDEKGMLAFATSRQPEHLYQFDREPTVEALEQSASYGVRDVTVPAGVISSTPMGPLAPSQQEEMPVDTKALELFAGGAALRFSREAASGLLLPSSWQPASGVECLAKAGLFPAFSLVEEQPTAPFQTQGMEDMDPVDSAWNPNVSYERKALVPSVVSMVRRRAGAMEELALSFDHPLYRGLTCRLDGRAADTLDVAVSMRFDADPTHRSYYLALPLNLPGEGDCTYWVDNCGVWFRAETDQLPGTCNSFYQAYRGVAVSRGGKTIYLASPDSTLFQFGGFTFGQLPSKPLQRKQPFIALWLYNNYWGTNFPSYSPGWARMRYRLQWRDEDFSEVTARRLDETFDRDYMTHPVA